MEPQETKNTDLKIKTALNAINEDRNRKQNNRNKEV